MDFINYKCPVCNKQFTKDDDIVVCPECGAPHHRECYELENRCFFEDKHSEDFSFEQLNAEKDNENTDDTTKDSDANIVVCKVCNTENPKETFYCRKCGAPLNEQDRQAGNNNQQNGQPGGFPFGTPFVQAQVINPFDPMAGLKSDEIIADNVTAGEMSKFVGKSTQYFLRIFDNIKKFNRSRFNFSAFLFSGMYFLYRKMILLGSIFSVLLIGFVVAEAYIQMQPFYQTASSAVFNAVNSGQYVGSLLNIPGVAQQDVLITFIPAFLELLRMIMMIVCGAIANRCYYKHCTKKINAVKAESKGEDVSKKLEEKGGVNLPLAICIGIAYLIINYLPAFLFYF